MSGFRIFFYFSLMRQKKFAKKRFFTSFNSSSIFWSLFFKSSSSVYSLAWVSKEWCDSLVLPAPWLTTCVWKTRWRRSKTVSFDGTGIAGRPFCSHSWNFAGTTCKRQNSGSSPSWSDSWRCRWRKCENCCRCLREDARVRQTSTRRPKTLGFHKWKKHYKGWKWSSFELSGAAWLALRLLGHVPVAGGTEACGDCSKWRR